MNSLYIIICIWLLLGAITYIWAVEESNDLTRKEYISDLIRSSLAGGLFFLAWIIFLLAEWYEGSALDKWLNSKP